MVNVSVWTVELPRSVSLSLRFFDIGPSKAGVMAEIGSTILLGRRLVRSFGSPNLSLPFSRASRGLFPSTLLARSEAISPVFSRKDALFERRVAFSSASLIFSCLTFSFFSIFVFLAAASTALFASACGDSTDSMLFILRVLMFQGKFKAVMPFCSRLDWLVLVTRVSPLTLRVFLPLALSSRQS